MAMSSRGATLSPIQFINFLSSPVKPSVTVPFRNKRVKLERIHRSEMRALKGSVGGIVERPTLDPSEFGVFPLEGGDIGRLTERKGTSNGDSYKVLLIDDPRHTEQLVEKVLPQVVSSVTPEKARSIFYESREKGVAVVIVTVKEHAEFYAKMMIRQGLRSAIEPDSELTS
ncbi:hypothetical protein LUZ60_011089 [Juncus effusus]|nr:hypothetical protein LUZ60_011089 [Juncus effusus]